MFEGKYVGLLFGFAGYYNIYGNCFIAKLYDYRAAGLLFN